jgi:hypothetical protein
MITCTYKINMRSLSSYRLKLQDTCVGILLLLTITITRNNLRYCTMMFCVSLIQIQAFQTVHLIGPMCTHVIINSYRSICLSIRPSVSNPHYTFPYSKVKKKCILCTTDTNLLVTKYKKDHSVFEFRCEIFYFL